MTNEDAARTALFEDLLREHLGQAAQRQEPAPRAAAVLPKGGGWHLIPALPAGQQAGPGRCPRCGRGMLGDRPGQSHKGMGRRWCPGSVADKEEFLQQAARQREAERYCTRHVRKTGIFGGGLHTVLGVPYGAPCNGTKHHSTPWWW